MYWIDKPHYTQCEDGRHYYCNGCRNLILEGAKSRNWCDECGLFAPRSYECICQDIQEMYR